MGIWLRISSCLRTLNLLATTYAPWVGKSRHAAHVGSTNTNVGADCSTSGLRKTIQRLVLEH